jgi:pyruvate/2-oxoglutarate/acetoin dehydrogenase E1 component
VKKKKKFCILHNIIDTFFSQPFTLLTQVIRQGSDITLVGWGAQLSIMEQACLDAEKVSDCFFETESRRTCNLHCIIFVYQKGYFDTNLRTNFDNNLDG